MEYRRLGKTELKVSRLGFGDFEIGGSKTNDTPVDKLINSAIDSGLNLIETAAADRKSEELIGRAIGSRRKEIVLILKRGAVDGFTRVDWSKKGILETIQNSLRLLKTDYLDVVQLDSCNIEILNRGEAIEALIVAKERGYARYTGYSGDGQDAKCAIETGFFDTLQTSISIADQEALDLTLPLAREQEMGVIAKHPIAKAVWRSDSKPEYTDHQEYWERIQELQYDFLNGDMNASVANALKFTLSVDGVTTAIVGNMKAGRWQENVDMLGQIEVSNSDFQKIRERWREISKGKNWVGQI